MSKQIKTNELLCLFDDAAFTIEEFASSAVVDSLRKRSSPLFWSHCDFFAQAVSVTAYHVPISARIESVRHQFHRQLVQITHGMSNSLISPVLF